MGSAKIIATAKTDWREETSKEGWISLFCDALKYLLGKLIVCKILLESWFLFRFLQTNLS
jgi:hypothetical protein